MGVKYISGIVSGLICGSLILLLYIIFCGSIQDQLISFLSKWLNSNATTIYWLFYYAIMVMIFFISGVLSTRLFKAAGYDMEKYTNSVIAGLIAGAMARPLLITIDIVLHMLNYGVEHLSRIFIDLLFSLPVMFGFISLGAGFAYLGSWAYIELTHPEK